MNETKKTEVSVEETLKELRENPSSRFSKTDYQSLVYAVLADKDFKAKKYLLRGDSIFEDEYSIYQGMYKFMDKLLKHAGFGSSEERGRILEHFEFGSRDVEWVSDAIDEATWLYTECGKNMRMFREKMLQLTLRKMIRSGKYDGKITYKKAIVDRALALQKRKKG